MHSHYLTVRLLGLSLLLVAGCGSSSGVPAHGTVKLNGEPIADGDIVFFATEGKAVIQTKIDNGKFQFKPENKLQPGKYRVEIYWKKKTGNKIKVTDPDREIDERFEVVPKQYNTDSTLTAEVGDGSKAHDFTLEGTIVKQGPASD